MSTIPEDLHYTPSHEWVRDEGDGTVTIGITDFAQEQLGDIVFVELPPAGSAVIAGEAVGVVDSHKSASDIYSPLAGVVEASNGELETGPERLNADPYAAWLLRVRVTEPAQLEGLLDADGYRAIVEQST